MTFPSCQSEQCYNETYWLKFCSRPQRRKRIDVGWRKCECGIQEAGRSPLMTGFWRLGQEVHRGGWDGSIYNGGSQTCQVSSCYRAFSMLSTSVWNIFLQNLLMAHSFPSVQASAYTVTFSRRPSQVGWLPIVFTLACYLLHAYLMALTLLENRLCIC